MHDNVYLGTSKYDLKYLHIAWIEQWMDNSENSYIYVGTVSQFKSLEKLKQYK